ncbi:MAG: hypothetical protein ACRDWA_11780 [Acidimicrobiia bacterium]
MEDGVTRTIGTIVFPDDERLDFVENGLIVHVTSEEELTSLLELYDAVVVRTGKVPILEGTTPPAGANPDTGRVLIRLDPARSPTDSLDTSLAEIGITGEVGFPSAPSAATVAAYLAESSRSVSLNLIADLTTDEHPTGSSTYLDAESWWRMTDEGLSIGVSVTSDAGWSSLVARRVITRGTRN